jgi:hypothetical protein
MRLEYEIVCEATVENGRNIDFLLRRGNSAFYLEATIARKSEAEQAADARRNRIYRELDKLEVADFMLGIEIESAGTRELRVGDLRRQLNNWLGTLNPDMAERQFDAIGEGPTFSWSDGFGWSLVFEAFPSKPEYRSQPAARPLGMFIDETGGLIDDERPLRGALSRKRPSYYGNLELPYVVAISEEPFAHGHEAWHRQNVMFGHHALEHGPVRPVRAVRMEDGIWRGPGARPRNRRLAAVLFASHLTPWTVDQTELEWWDHPFANQPVPDDVIPDVVHRWQVHFDANDAAEFRQIEAPRTPGSILLQW